MKKRVFAFLMAALLVLSSLLLAGCENKTDDSDDVNSTDESINVENLSAKELFGISIFNSVLGSTPEVPDVVTDADSGVSMKVSADINKLTVEGQDITNGKPLTAEFELKADIEKMIAEIKANASVLGDKLSADAVISTNGIYVVDVLGINGSPISIPLDELGIDKDMIDQILEQSTAMTDKATKAIEKYITDIVESINKNISDDKFVSENKDVTVDGKEFKGAKVITFTVDAETAKALVSDVITALAENDDLLELMEMPKPTDEELEETLTEMKESLDEVFGSIEVVNTVVGSESVAFDVKINFNQVSKSASATDGGEVKYEEQITPYTFGLKSTFVDSNANIKLGFIDGNGEFVAEDGYFVYDYKLNGENESLKLALVEEDGETVILELNGTLKNGKHEGTLALSPEMGGVSIKYAFEEKANGGKLSISQITVKEGSTSVSIDLDLAIDYKVTDSEISMKVDVKFDMEDEVSIDASFAISFTSGNVNINEPSNSMSYKEIDEDTLMDWASKLEDKLPNIMKYVNDIMNQEASVVSPNF